MPVAAALVPPPAGPASTTATERPRRARRHPIDSPITPAPTTTTSTRGGRGSTARSRRVAATVKVLNRTGRPVIASLLHRHRVKKLRVRERAAGVHPYAGANRIRFYGYPRRLQGRPSGVSAPCRGSPWNGREMGPRDATVKPKSHVAQGHRICDEGGGIGAVVLPRSGDQGGVAKRRRIEETASPHPSPFWVTPHPFRLSGGTHLLPGQI